MQSSPRDRGRSSVGTCRQRRRVDRAGTATSTPASSPTSSNVPTKAMPPRTGSSFSSSPVGRWRRRLATPANPRCPCPDRHSQPGRLAASRGSPGGFEPLNRDAAEQRRPLCRAGRPVMAPIPAAWRRYRTTTSTRPSSGTKSSPLRVYSGRPAARAVAAMSRSTARPPRALRPVAMTAEKTRP